MFILKTLRNVRILLLISFIFVVILYTLPATAQTCPHDGDVNQDGMLTPADALLAFQSFLSIASPPLDTCQLARANTDTPEATGITPADALCIFQRFLGLLSCLDANPAFNGTFSGDISVSQNGQTTADAITLTLTVGSPLHGTFSTGMGVTGTIAGQAVGKSATFTGTLEGNCPGTITSGSAVLMDDNTLSVDLSGSNCEGPFRSTGALSQDDGGGGSSATILNVCREDCQTAQRVCGDNLFFDEYESVDDCTDECVDIVEDFASDADNFDACANAQVQFIECCTRQSQCGEIPDGCDAEFDGAVITCGGSFGGCPLIFF